MAAMQGKTGPIASQVMWAERIGLSPFAIGGVATVVLCEKDGTVVRAALRRAMNAHDNDCRIVKAARAAAESCVPPASRVLP